MVIQFRARKGKKRCIIQITVIHADPMIGICNNLIAPYLISNLHLLWCKVTVRKVSVAMKIGFIEVTFLRKQVMDLFHSRLLLRSVCEPKRQRATALRRPLLA